MVLECGSLDKKMLRIHLAVVGVSFSSTLFTSRPVTTAFSKRPFQVFVAVLAFLIMVVAVTQWMDALGTRTRVAAQWKFSALQLRHESLTDPDHCRNAAATLTIKNAGHALPSKVSHSVDGDVVIELNAGVSVVDEWCFRTDEEDGSKDPVRFALHTSDDGVAWSQVASSSSYIELIGPVGFYDGLFNTPDIRGADVCFPMSPHFGWKVLQAFSSSGQFVTTVYVEWLALRGNEDRARKFYAASLAGMAVNLVLQGYGALRAAGLQKSEKFVTAAVVPCIWSYTIFFREHHFLKAIMASSVVDFLINVARFEGDGLHLAWLGAVHGTILVLGCCVLVYKRQAMLGAAILVAVDKGKYDAEWSDVCKVQLDALIRLQTLVRINCPYAGRVLQLNPDGTKKQSLDQLYFEASQANEILKRKVVAWGKASNGFLVSSSYAAMYKLVRCAELEGNKEDEMDVKWASIKASSRAIEKVYRSYMGEVAELADLCRQSIIFQTVDDVAACLQAMLADPGCRLLRVKNRFDPSFDSAESSGFRNVAVSIELWGEMAGDLKGGGGGGWQHVCEVQLHLEAFYALSSAEGHRRYVEYRNLSGV